MPDPADPGVTGRAGPAGERHPWAWLWLLLGGGVVVALYSVLPPGVQDGTYLAVGLVSAAAIVVGTRIHRPPRPLPWYLMAAGQLVWTGGDAVGAWEAVVLDVERFPAPADGFYLAAYPLIAAGMLLLIRGRLPRRDLAGFLDSMIVTAALGLLSWVLLARPTVDQYQESVPAAVVGLAYPVCDIVMVGIVVRLLVTPGGRTPALRLLLTAIGLLVVADTAATALELVTYSSTGVIDLLWLASYVIWGAAALHPSMYALSQPTPAEYAGVSRARLAALTLAVLTPPIVLGGQQALGGRLDVWAVVAASVVIFGLVMARMGVAVGQLVATSREREKLQTALAHQASHDALTGLPNRGEAIRLIRGALHRAQRSGAVIGLLFVDLDGFKKINDTLGHAAGDEVLRVVAERLRSEVRAGDVVARLGGDEFVVLLEPLDEQASALAVADRMVEVSSAPVLLGSGRRVRLGASVGVALSQDGVTDPDALLVEADTAVYRAKAAGRGRTEMFDTTLRDELAARADLESALTAALHAGQLVVHYQPVVALATGDVRGYEALVRWQRPGSGLLAARDFLPVAAHSDLIVEVDRFVLGAATRQLAGWRSGSAAMLTMAINVSGRYVAQPQFVDDVRSAVATAGVRPARLVLELTESTLLDDPLAVDNLVELRRSGVGISIDDFVAGYESIARLEALPVDSIKISETFLADESRTARRVLTLVVQAAHAFELPVIAEGVERADQLEVLRGLGCEFGQGFLFGPAQPADRITAPTALPLPVGPANPAGG